MVKSLKVLFFGLTTLVMGSFTAVDIQAAPIIGGFSIAGTVVGTNNTGQRVSLATATLAWTLQMGQRCRQLTFRGCFLWSAEPEILRRPYLFFHWD